MNIVHFFCVGICSRTSSVVAVVLFLFLFMVSCDSAGLNSSPVPTKSITQLMVDSRTTTTLMVYMSAGGGDDSLAHFLVKDLEEMRSGSEHTAIRVLAYADIPKGTEPKGGWYGTRVFEIFNGNIKRLGVNSLGLTSNDQKDLPVSEDTLQKFLTFSLSNYADDNNALVLWGHGIGIWRSLQSTRSGTDSATNKQTRQFLNDGNTGGDTVTILDTAAIGRATRRALDATGKKLVFIAFDTCLGSQYELAYELASQQLAKYMIASENLVPATGWDYSIVLKKIAGTRTRKNIVEQIVTSYKQEGVSKRHSDIAVYDLDRYGVLNEKFKDYAEKLNAILFVDADGDGNDDNKLVRVDAIKKLVGLFGHYSKGGKVQSFFNEEKVVTTTNNQEGKPSARMIDLASFVREVAKGEKDLAFLKTDKSFQAASAAVLAAIDDTIIAKWQHPSKYLHELGGISIAYNIYRYTDDQKQPIADLSKPSQLLQAHMFNDRRANAKPEKIPEKDAQALKFVRDGGLGWTPYIDEGEKVKGVLYNLLYRR